MGCVQPNGKCRYLGKRCWMNVPRDFRGHCIVSEAARRAAKKRKKT